MVAKGRRALSAVLALCVLGALVVALPASAAGGPLAHLETVMTGEKEVPGPGDPNGKGEAKVKVFRAKVCYRLTAKRIKPATAAHIHRGVRGEAGPVVVPLKPPTDGSSRGCADISRSLSRALREHPGRYYVNVHNRPYPDGAIRGQLERD
jgi:CHRD domain-containing protein